jgi:hypothetical protein
MGGVDVSGSPQRRSGHTRGRWGSSLAVGPPHTALAGTLPLSSTPPARVAGPSVGARLGTEGLLPAHLGLVALPRSSLPSPDDSRRPNQETAALGLSVRRRGTRLCATLIFLRASGRVPGGWVRRMAMQARREGRQRRGGVGSTGSLCGEGHCPLSRSPPSGAAPPSPPSRAHSKPGSARQGPQGIIRTCSGGDHAPATRAARLGAHPEPRPQRRGVWSSRTSRNLSGLPHATFAET